MNEYNNPSFATMFQIRSAGTELIRQYGQTRRIQDITDALMDWINLAQVSAGSGLL
jgi:hypothetical protein